MQVVSLDSGKVEKELMSGSRTQAVFYNGVCRAKKL